MASLKDLTEKAATKKRKYPFKTILQQRVSVYELETGALLGRGYSYYDHDMQFYHYLTDLKGIRLPNGNYDIREDGELVPVITPFDVQ